MSMGPHIVTGNKCTKVPPMNLASLLKNWCSRRPTTSWNRRKARCRPAFEILEDRLAPSAWIVTDPNGTAGSGSLTDLTLPYAVAHAQSGDEITFASGLSGDTITLNSTLAINANVTITGLGAANLAISNPVGGGFYGRGFYVNSGVTASISELTVEDCYAANQGGGGICNNGTLTISNVTLSGNSAGSGGALLQRRLKLDDPEQCDPLGEFGWLRRRWNQQLWCADHKQLHAVRKFGGRRWWRHSQLWHSNHEQLRLFR